MSGRLSFQGYQRTKSDNSPKKVLSTKQPNSTPPKPQFVLCDNNEFPSLSKKCDRLSSDSDSRGQKYSDKLKTPFHSTGKKYTDCLNKNDHVHNSDCRENQSCPLKHVPSRSGVKNPDHVEVAGKTTCGKSVGFKTKDHYNSAHQKKNKCMSENVRFKTQLPKQGGSVYNYDSNNKHTHQYRNQQHSLNSSKALGKVSESVSKTIVPSSDNQSKKEADETASKQSGDISSTATKAAKKKRRKSKVKRLAAAQSGKISLVTAEIHSKILNQSNSSVSKISQNILYDLNNEEEYPVLGKVPPVSFKTESKEGLSPSLLEDVKLQVPCETDVKDKVIVSSSEKLEIEKPNAKEKKKNKSVHAHDPITLKFLDMLVKKSSKSKDKELKDVAEPTVSAALSKVKPKKDLCNAPNFLDSSGPLIKRGKERENPKPKKPSHLKKIILLDRKLRKEQLLQLKDNKVQEQEVSNDGVEIPIETDCCGKDVESEGLESNEENDPALSTLLSSQQKDLSFIRSEILSQTEGNNVALTERCTSETIISSLDCKNTVTGSDELDSRKLLLKSLSLSAEVNDNTVKEKSAKILLHTRNFREYCDHLISEDIDQAVHALLDDLARFQDRLHQKDPVKARAKKRMIYGVKEVKKYIKLRKLKCVIIATDIENVESEGGLNDMLNDIKMLSREHCIPCVFALGRKALGKVCRKPVPVSCIGVFNADGSEVNLKKIIVLVSQSKTDYMNILSDLMSKLSDNEMNALINARKEAPESLHDIRSNIFRRLFVTSQSNESKTEAFDSKFADSSDSDSA